MFAEIVRTATTVWRRYPVEIGILFCLLAAWWHDYLGMPEPSWAALAPMAAVSALALNLGFASGRKRIPYYLSWLPWLAIAVFVPAETLRTWSATSQYVITALIISPLVMLLSLHATDNRKFVADTQSYANAIIGTGICAAVINLLWHAIWYSITYIFGLGENKIVGHIIGDGRAVINTVLIGTILLSFIDILFRKRAAGTSTGTRHFADGIINYMLTPALLIYTAILYIYLAKIVATWSLPKGGVAYMVFGYAITAYAVKALRETSGRKMFDAFFNRLSFTVLPTLILFWAGVAHRVAEYGYTDWRVYLVVCGAIMTVCTLLFLSHSAGRYYYVAATAAAMFFATAYIPYFSAERIGLRSQADRAERIAERTGLLDKNGQLKLSPLDTIDTLLIKDYYELGQSLRYISMNNDTLTLRNRFGIDKTAEYYDIFPQKYRYRILYDWNDSYDTVEVIDSNLIPLSASSASVADIRGFSAMYLNPNYRELNDTLRIVLPDMSPDTLRIPLADIMRTQMRKAGFSDGKRPTAKDLEAAADRILTYDRDGMTIIFSRMDIIIGDRDSLSFDRLSVDKILLR